jgi:MFS family permease
LARPAATAALAAAIVLALFAFLPAEAVQNWGWRLVFGLGTLIGPVGLWMRARMGESPTFEKLAAGRHISRAPLRAVLSRYPRELAGMAGLIVISSAALYLIIIFLPLFAVRELGITQSGAQLSTIIACLIEAGVILASGWLADRFDALAVLTLACMTYALAAYPLFAYLVAAPGLQRLIIVQLAAAVLLGAMSGPLPLALSMLLPAEVRTTGVGLIYNVVGSIFGGLGPLIITAAIAATEDLTAPAWWAALTGMIGAVAAFVLWRFHDKRPALLI